VDGYRLSSYLYKDKNDRLNCGPIWDFNLTYGNADYYNGWLTTGFQYQANLGYDNSQNPFWWGKLMRDSDYVKKLRRRWTLLRRNELSSQRITFVIDSLTSVIAEAKDRNYQKWTGVIGVDIWPNYYVGSTYSAEVTWMKNWINLRLNWLDQQWPYDFTGNDHLLATGRRSVFPNPFSDKLTVQLSSDLNTTAYAELYQTSGKLMEKIPVQIENGRIQIDLAGQKAIKPGMYLLRITSFNKVLLNEKVVKI
jgi:hypothetical protein